jgi:endonuclease/exonuclease/phosphatase (EEP) superfamily protein YafD
MADRVRTGLAIAAAAPWAAWALVRLLSLDRLPILAQAMAFTPYVALLTPVPFVVGLLLLRPRIAVASLLPGLVLVGLVAPRTLPGPRTDPGPGAAPLRVLTVNLFGGAADLRQVVALADAERVDVLSLQEVSPETLAALDEQGLSRVLPRRVDGARPGSAGTVLATRLELLDERVEEDPIGFAQAVATVRSSAGRPVDVVAVHPPPPLDGERHAAWRRILDRLPPAGEGRVRVLAGDFNATLDHHMLRRVLGRGYQDVADVDGSGLTTTWPVGRRFPPALTIDRVLADRRLGVGRFVVREIRGSDHKAVLADLLIGR